MRDREFRPAAWMREEMERRKALHRRLWDGKPMGRIPIDVRVDVPSRSSLREEFLDRDKQLERALRQVAATWALGADNDTIPAMRPDVGCSCLASAFGADYYWGESEDQTPGIRKKVIRDVEKDVERMAVPDPLTDGWLPEGLRRIRVFADAGDGFVPVSLLDAAGGVNVAADLMGIQELLVGFYTAPHAIHRLLDKIQQLFLETIRLGIDAAGGQEYITTTDFPDLWFPDGLKGHVSDDISANFGPEIYAEFSAPYHERVFREYGPGGLHNCGPNPCHRAYVGGSLPPRSVDLSDTYSHGDLPELKKSLKKKAFIYLLWDNIRNQSADPVAWYRDIMELMAPDVIVVPTVILQEQDQPKEVCRRLIPIAEEYARRMDWGWEAGARPDAG